MDPQTDLPDLVEDLEVNIDELTTTLAPLLPPTTLHKTATSLPLLDKAKLHVLAAYAIESTLFSTLQASGADAKSHALFAELARLKAYFAKIKHAEDHVANLAAREKRARLDVGAAQRFIKHGLSGNERYDEMRKDRLAGEKQRALDKARALTNIKFDDAAEKRRGEDAEDEGTPKKKAKLDGSAEGEEDEEGAEEAEEAEEQEEAEGAEEQEEPLPAPKKRGRKSKPTDLIDTTPQHPNQDQPPAKKKRGRPSKTPAADPSTPQKHTHTRATRSSASKTKPKPRGKAKK